MFAYCNNNPVNGFDPTGHFNDVLALRSRISYNNYSCDVGSAGGLLVGGFALGIVSSIPKIGEKIYEEIKEEIQERDNSVYVLKDATGTVQYVGRTKNVDRRRAAHSANPYRRGLQMEVIASGLTLPEARALEQAGMTFYHTINTANRMNNQINSVAPNYWPVFKELALSTMNYGWNQMTNEILYWAGN